MSFRTSNHLNITSHGHNPQRLPTPPAEPTDCEFQQRKHTAKPVDMPTSCEKYPRISRPVELMRRAYDCVVIGSGYGGSVAAARMARAGQRVCVLELGKERWPGEYPTSTAEAWSELHCSGELDMDVPLLGSKSVELGSCSPTSMFHLVCGKGQHAIVGAGLGGTSLINANVFLRADAEAMAQEAWPPELREKGALDEYYEKVESVLEPQTYPEDWPRLAKLDLLEKQASLLHMQDNFRRVTQTTRFHDGPNSCGVQMTASSLTGQDCTGLNDGSKTTTLVTYLADAWNWGAEMFCECEVRYIEQVPAGGYRIWFAWHGRRRDCFAAHVQSDLLWVHAREAVFLGAGALGTTEILLRSKARGGLRLSDQIGRNMSGNGDILAYGYNTDDTANAIGRPCPSPYQPVGPTITGVIDNRSGHNSPLDGFVIEEGAVPQALAGFLQTMLELLPRDQTVPDRTLFERARAALASAGSRLLGPYCRQGAVEKTQIYLVMSHDSNQAVLSLQDDRPVLEFQGVGRSDHVRHINGILARATEVVGGTLIGNPFHALLGQEVTVHPIGGAAMARDNTGRTGATDHRGRLFTGNGSEVHRGLIVTDGALVPAALGVNPLAAIAALAERSVQLYAESRGLVVQMERNGLLDLFGQPAHVPDTSRDYVSIGSDGEEEGEEDEEDDEIQVAHSVMERAAAVQVGGFGFTEVMSGFLHGEITKNDEDGDEDDRRVYEMAYQTGRSLCESARIFLSMEAFDTRALVQGNDHAGMLTGTLVCPTLPGSPFLVQRGLFQLFVADHDAPDTRHLAYDFALHGTSGETLHFHGRKIVDAAVTLAPQQLWRATTTLYVQITQKSKTVARGIMRLEASDLATELRTLAPTGAGMLPKLASTTRFLGFFAQQSLAPLLGPLGALQYPRPTVIGFVNETLPTRVWTDIRASDGVCSRLYMWEPPQTKTSCSSDIPNLFMVPGASVDHQIFALPTIPCNAVNFFTQAGYRVFVIVHRIGQQMHPDSHWTTFDARLDIRAALAHIRSQYAVDKVYTIAHCMGAVALAAGLLDGTVPASWLLGLSCSQVFLHPLWSPVNRVKAQGGWLSLDRLYGAVGGNWFSCRAVSGTSGRLLDQALRALPDRRVELCRNASCHRTSLVFGRCWNHANLNEVTHRQIDRFFGGVNMSMLDLLMRQGRHGSIMSNGPDFTELSTPENIQRLQGLPVFLFVGGDNAVLSPAATEKTYEVLCDAFGSGPQYSRRVIPGYGHLDCWMGRHAWRDVYPVVLAEVERVRQ